MDYHQPPTLSADRLVHAYLLLVGKGRQATTLVHSWLAVWRVHPMDQVWLVADQTITIAAIRDFQRQLQLAPLVSPRRIGVIPAAQLLSPEANHALLKFLEDPPTHVTTLLVAEHEEQLLPTIVSRCQRWRIPDMLSSEVETHLTSPEISLNQLMSVPYRERFQWAELWAKESDFVQIFDRLMRQAHEAFLRQQLTTGELKKMLLYRSLAETNANSRLLAETMLMALPRLGN